MRTFILAIIFFLPSLASAASVSLTPTPVGVRVGDTFAVAASVQTGSASVNAVEGAIQFPESLALVAVRLDGSLVPLWVTPPDDSRKGVVHFAGVLPGGFSGDGLLFTLIFTARNAGRTEISLAPETQAYRNDGEGTILPLDHPSLQLAIGERIGAPSAVDVPEDTVPPEPFTPSIERGERFGGSGTVLVFLAQDKNTGIERYDIARSYSPRERENALAWRSAESPYVLQDGDALRYLYLRAVDRAGNTRIAMVGPQSFSPLALIVAWWPLLLVAGVCAVILISPRYRRLRKNRAV